jgi:hypothetical protein
MANGSDLSLPATRQEYDSQSIISCLQTNARVNLYYGFLLR